MIKISETGSLDKHYPQNFTGIAMPESIKPHDAVPFVNVRPELVDSGDGLVPTGNDLSENCKTSVIGLLSVYDEKNRVKKYTRFDELNAGQPNFHVDTPTKLLRDRLNELHLIDGTQVTVGNLSYNIVGEANQFQEEHYKASGNRYRSIIGYSGYMRLMATVYTNIGGGIGSNLLLNFGMGTFFTGEIIGGGTLTPSDTADEFGIVLNIRNNTWHVDWAVPTSYTAEPLLPTSGSFDTGVNAYAFQMMGFEVLGVNDQHDEILKIMVGDIYSPSNFLVGKTDLLDGIFYKSPFEFPEFYDNRAYSLDFYKMAYMFFRFINGVGGFPDALHNNMAFGLSRLNVPVDDITVLYPQYINGLGQHADFGYGTYLYDMYFERYDPQNDYAQQSLAMMSRFALQRLDDHVMSGGNGGEVVPPL